MDLPFPQFCLSNEVSMSFADQFLKFCFEVPAVWVGDAIETDIIGWNCNYAENIRSVKGKLLDFSKKKTSINIVIVSTVVHRTTFVHKNLLWMDSVHFAERPR